MAALQDEADHGYLYKPGETLTAFLPRSHRIDTDSGSVLLTAWTPGADSCTTPSARDVRTRRDGPRRPKLPSGSSDGRHQPGIQTASGNDEPYPRLILNRLHHHEGM